jgi:acetyl-CoA carboxylase beta subunit
LPAGFQTAEFLTDRGLIDAIVSRLDMKEALVDYISYMMVGRMSAVPGK